MADPPVSIVTGASQGIGQVIAIELAARGDTVVLAARNADGLEETAAHIDRAGGEQVVIETDVTSAASVASMVAMVIERQGRIDNLVNNSGVGGPSGRLWEVDPGEWRSTYDVNVFGVFEVSRVVLPVMVEQGSGSVVVVGSISGKRPLFGRSAYTSTKTALIGLTRTLALEVGPHGIRVNLVSPGFVSGPRIEWVMKAQSAARGIDVGEVRREFEDESPLGRLTDPHDVATAVAFLTSDGAAGITGADINVNSGVVMY
ncbi:MAG TPA: SDR family NAD(P)-dependent oxidoreductase [Acidimicrobiia bacterium]|nr:SDR family NAD(P)-dependent oxidoreductase [Acidimicrobiia bacterium]